MKQCTELGMLMQESKWFGLEKEENNTYRYERSWQIKQCYEGDDLH